MSFLLLLGVAPLAAQPLPPDLDLDPFANGLSNALAVRHAGDGSGRLFVVRQQGLVSLIRADGSVAPTAFLNLGNTGTAPPLGFTTGGERGLLGLAFHPMYALNGRFFVYYTDTGGDTAVTEYRVSDNDPERADAASGRVILRVWQPASNHNGGDIHFGPDGYLYIGLGDGGGGNDQHCNAGQALNPAQLFSSAGGNCSIAGGDTFLQVPNADAPRGNADSRALLGKMLRIDVDLETPRTPPAAGADMCGRDPDTGQARYDTPPDNPFAGDGGSNAAGCDEIYHYGLRNPWRFSFDRATDDLIIGDVGQNRWEEIDLVPPGGGRNFGWNPCEGFHQRGSTSTLCTLAGRTEPIMTYGRSTGFSTTGGYRYRGPYPELDGVLFFADYGGAIFAEIEGMGGWDTSPAPWRTGQGDIVGFGEDEGGSVYVATLDGTVRKFVLDATALPAALVAHAHARLSIDAGTLGLADGGDTIEVRVSALNGGGAALHDLAVSGGFAGAPPAALDCTPTALAPNQGATCTTIFRVLEQAAFEAQTSLTFSIDAGARDPDEAEVAASDSVTLALAPLRAELTADKSATLDPDLGTPGVADAGDGVGYTVTVTNTGNVNLHALSVLDQFDGGASMPLQCSPTALAPGEIANCEAYGFTVTQAQIDAQQPLLNVVSASARDAAEAEVTAMADADVVVAAAAPALGFDKQVELQDDDGDGLADPNETLIYRFVVTNTGNLTLSAVGVDDPKLGGAVACVPATLAPQDVADCGPVHYVVGAAEALSGTASNTARARGNPPEAGDPLWSAEDGTEVATDTTVALFADGFESD